MDLIFREFYDRTLYAPARRECMKPYMDLILIVPIVLVIATNREYNL